MKILRYFIIIFIGFQLTSCDDVFPREEEKDRIVFTIEPRLDKDNNFDGMDKFNHTCGVQTPNRRLPLSEKYHIQSSFEYDYRIRG